MPDCDIAHTVMCNAQRGTNEVVVIGHEGVRRNSLCTERKMWRMTSHLALPSGLIFWDNRIGEVNLHSGELCWSRKPLFTRPTAWEDLVFPPGWYFAQQNPRGWTWWRRDDNDTRHHHHGGLFRSPSLDHRHRYACIGMHQHQTHPLNITSMALALGTGSNQLFIRAK